MEKLLKISFVMLIVSAVLTSCKKDDDHDHDHDHKHDNEFITRVAIRYQNTSNAADTFTISWVGKMMGSVVVPDRIDTLRVKPSTTYSGSIRFFDDVNKKEITTEIEKEAKEHLLYYTYTPVSGGNISDVVIENRNVDSDAKPLGTTFQLKVNASTPTSGSLRVDLRHFSGSTKTDNPNAGSSDFSGVFPLVVF